jgi:hypothetical protein
LRDDDEYVALEEQHAPAGRAVTGDLAGHQPSLNCAHMHAAQVSDLAFRQKLLAIGSIHDGTCPFVPRASASAIRTNSLTTVWQRAIDGPVNFFVEG